MDAETGRSRRFGKLFGYARVVLAALVGFAFAWFVVQNSSVVQVSWLFFDTDAPLWVVVSAAAAIGAILGKAVGWVTALRSSRGPGNADAADHDHSLRVASVDRPGT